MVANFLLCLIYKLNFFTVIMGKVVHVYRGFGANYNFIHPLGALEHTSMEGRTSVYIILI
jgi:hypothetical protein